MSCVVRSVVILATTITIVTICRTVNFQGRAAQMKHQHNNINNFMDGTKPNMHTYSFGQIFLIGVFLMKGNAFIDTSLTVHISYAWYFIKDQIKFGKVFFSRPFCILPQCDSSHLWVHLYQSFDQWFGLVMTMGWWIASWVQIIFFSTCPYFWWMCCCFCLLLAGFQK